MTGLWIAVGIVAGAAVAALVLRPRIAELRTALTHAEREREAKVERVLELERESAGLRATLETERRAVGEHVKAATSEAMPSFVELARSQLGQAAAPIKESLERVDAAVKALEQVRRQDYGSLSAQVRTLAETSERLRSETGNLVTALRSPSVRGRWGEMQLRRAVEAAGMLAYCDFVEQVSATDDDRLLRPDLVVKLPGGRNVVIDAKAPLQGLLDALQAQSDDERAAGLRDFARHVREHVAKLSGKAYWAQFSPAPDFVIMFLPGESFFRAALEQDPSLLETTAGQRVILASPYSLITLLRAVAVGWREERVADSARAVNELGRELYERLATMTEHFGTLGRRLDGAVQAYNQAVGSFERRVLVSARRFTEHGIGPTKELGMAAPVERSAQPPQTVELAPRAAVPEVPAGEADAA